MVQTDNKRTSVATCVDKLDLWERVSISRPDDTNKVCLESRVDDSDNDMLYLSFTEKDPRVSYGSRIEVTFVKDEGLYQFDAILDTGVRDQRQYLTLRPTSGVRHVQRRTAVRVDMRLELEISQIQRPITSQIFSEYLNWQPSVTADFSASGILTRVTRGFVVGDLVAIRFARSLTRGAPRTMLSSWRRLAKIGDTAFMGLQFIPRERTGEFLLPAEIEHISTDLLQLTTSNLDSFGKFVFDYELQLRQQGKY